MEEEKGELKKDELMKALGWRRNSDLDTGRNCLPASKCAFRSVSIPFLLEKLILSGCFNPFDLYQHSAVSTKSYPIQTGDR